MAYGAVRVHPDEGLAHLGISGMHLSNGVSLGFGVEALFRLKGVIERISQGETDRKQNTG